MKTTSELNSRWWYRLAKVFYLFTLIISLILAVAISYSENNGLVSLNVKESIIGCGIEYSTQQSFPIIDVGSYYFEPHHFSGNNFLYKEFFSEYGNEYVIKDILRECRLGDTAFQEGVTNNDIYVIQRMFEINRMNITDTERTELRNTELHRLNGAYSTDQKLKLLSFSNQLFFVYPVYDYVTTPGIIIASILGIIAVFEFIRRIFYYIVLGTIRPKKHESDPVRP